MTTETHSWRSPDAALPSRMPVLMDTPRGPVRAITDHAGRAFAVEQGLPNFGTQIGSERGWCVRDRDPGEPDWRVFRVEMVSGDGVFTRWTVVAAGADEAGRLAVDKNVRVTAQMSAIDAKYTGIDNVTPAELALYRAGLVPIVVCETDGRISEEADFDDARLAEIAALSPGCAKWAEGVLSRRTGAAPSV